MATNQFLQFAYAVDAYVRSNPDWLASALRDKGYPAGILEKEDLNKAIRQGTAMAAAMGKFISDQGFDALDDGNVANLEAGFVAALTNEITTVVTPLISVAVPSYLLQNAGII